MSIIQEMEAMARLAGIPVTQVRPASKKVYGLRVVDGPAPSLHVTLAVAKGEIFVATHGDCDAFALDGSQNPIFGTRQTNPPYGDIIYLYYLTNNTQERSATIALRELMGDIFLLFREGSTGFAASMDTTDVNVASPQTLQIFLNITLRGFILPSRAINNLANYQMQVL